MTETLHVHAVIGQMWPSLSAYLQSQAHPQLDPLLAQNKPAWMDDIKLVRCPHVGRLLVARLAEPLQRDMSLHALASASTCGAKSLWPTFGLSAAQTNLCQETGRPLSIIIYCDKYSLSAAGTDVLSMCRFELGETAPQVSNPPLTSGLVA